MTKKQEEKVMKIVKILTETIFTTDETESCLLFWTLDSLKKIPIDIHMLEATGVGKVVNHLRKHRSNQVSEIASTLIKKWKAIANDSFDKTSSSIPPLKIRLNVGKSKPQPATPEINKQQQQHVQEVIAEKENGGMQKTTVTTQSPASAPTSIYIPPLKIRLNAGKSKPQPPPAEGMKKEATAAVNVNTRMDKKLTDGKNTETSPAIHSSITVNRKNRAANHKANNKTITTKKKLFEEEEEEEAADSAKPVQSTVTTSKRKLDDSYQNCENGKKQKTMKAVDNDVLKPPAAAARANSKSMKTSKHAAISKRLNAMKRNNHHQSKRLLPY